MQTISKKFEIGFCIFRRDLRVADNPALFSALELCRKVVAIYDPVIDLRRLLGQNQQWWLGKALQELKINLAKLGVQLIFGQDNFNALNAAQELGVQAIFWNHVYLQDVFARDERLAIACGEAGIEVFAFKASLILNPWEIENKQGKPFRVFTPFYKELGRRYEKTELLPLPKPQETNFEVNPVQETSLALDLPQAPIDAGVAELWQPGEYAAHKVLANFCENKIEDYAAQRDFLALNATSNLSPYLHFGHLSPQQIILHVTKSSSSVSSKAFLRQLIWREFAWHLLYHFPKIATENFDKKFDNFAWINDEKKLELWQRAATGFPIVDAAMTELVKSGTMHNRARMVVASFLVKDLMLDWRHGEAFFWQHLVDADEANNLIGWQWTAGCGPDPAPFFRIFNPLLQSKKFDAEGAYIKKWLPLLKKLSKKYIHEPSKAPAKNLAEAGLELGKNYAWPIVDHSLVAKKSMAAYKQIK